MSRTAYIAGTINGLQNDKVNNKYNVITNQLSNMGYQVVSPRVGDDSKTWEIAVHHDIRKMLDCDEVHLLPDWQKSRGAQLERDIALRMGLPVVYH